MMIGQHRGPSYLCHCSLEGGITSEPLHLCLEARVLHHGLDLYNN